MTNFDPPSATLEPAFAGLCRQLVRSWAPEDWGQAPLLVAVSGGSDSVGLLRAMLAVSSERGEPVRTIVAHVDHGWRGADSTADAEWVRQLADQHKCDCHVLRPARDVTASEQAARDVRLMLLKDLAARVGARFVVMAHTRDDQVETILMRLLRGTGLRGLQGIAPFRQLGPHLTLARPLLNVTRLEIQAALQTIGQDWRTDSTNDDRSFTRNWVRHELLPLVRDRMPHDVDQALLQTASQAAAWTQWIERLAGDWVDQYVQMQRTSDSTCATVHAKDLLAVTLAGEQLPRLVLTEVLREVWRRADWPQVDMGQHEWQRVLAVLEDSASSPIEVPGGVRISPAGKQVYIVGPVAKTGQFS